MGVWNSYVGCSCIGLYLAVRAAYEIELAFRSVFRFVSDNIEFPRKNCPKNGLKKNVVS